MYVNANQRPHSTANSRSLEQCEVRMPRPPIQLDEHAQSLSQILQNYSLPRVVQCDNKSLEALSSTGSALDFTNPLLLFKKRSVRKVSAHSLFFDNSSKEFTGVGSDLLIPEDYKGFFAVLGHPDDCHTDHVIPFYGMASKLAISPCTVFLVGGDMPIMALRVEGGMQSNIKPVQCQLFPGDVLRKGRFFEATSTVQTKGKGVFGRRKLKERKENFLQCFDHADREVLLPDTTQGTFVPLAQESGSIRFPVVTLKGLLERYRLPVIVKLVYGRVPTTPCSFTGTLLLTDSGMDKTVIASTLLNLRNINIELPLSAGLHFHVAEHTPGLLASRAYEDASNMCQLQADTYMRNMKVCFTSIDPRRGSDSSSSGDPKQKESSTRTGDSLPRSQRSSCDSKSSSSSGSSRSVPGDRSERSSDMRRSFPDVEGPGFTNRSASTISRTSVWSEITSAVTVNDREHGIFVPTAQRTPPPQRQLSNQSKKSVKSGGSFAVADNTKVMRELLVFQKPKPPVAEVIPITPGGATARPAGTVGRGRTLSTPSVGLDYAQYETLSREGTLVPPVPDYDASENPTDTYMTMWEARSQVTGPHSAQDPHPGPEASSIGNDQPTLPRRPTHLGSDDPGYLFAPRFADEIKHAVQQQRWSVDFNNPASSVSRVEVRQSPTSASQPPLFALNSQKKGIGRFLSDDTWQVAPDGNGLTPTGSASFDSESMDCEDPRETIYENLAALRLVRPESLIGQPSDVPTAVTNTSFYETAGRVEPDDDGGVEFPPPPIPPPIPPLPKTLRPLETAQVQPDIAPPVLRHPPNKAEYNALDQRRLSVNPYQPIFTGPSPTWTSTNTLQRQTGDPQAPNIYDELYHYDQGNADENNLNEDQVEKRPMTDRDRRTADSGVYMSIADIPDPPKDENSNKLPSSTFHGIGVLDELRLKMAKKSVSPVSPKTSTNTSFPFDEDVDGQTNRNSTLRTAKVNTPFPLNGDGPQTPNCPESPNATAMFPRSPTAENRTNKRSSQVDQGAPKSTDPLHDIGDAGLRPNTVSALRGLTHEKISSCFKTEIEMEELRTLLPQVNGIELSKVLMYLKAKAAKN